MHHADLNLGSTDQADNDPVCITCSDQGVVARIVALSGDGWARVDTGCTIEEVSVELIDGAAPDDVVLIHAKVAIAKLGPAS
jgi:hypothetical protein